MIVIDIHSRLDGLLGHPQIIRIHNKYGMQTTTVIPISLAQHGIRSVSHMWAYFSAAASKNYYACVYTNTLCRTRSRVYCSPSLKEYLRNPVMPLLARHKQRKESILCAYGGVCMCVVVCEYMRVCLCVACDIREDYNFLGDLTNVRTH